MQDIKEITLKEIVDSIVKGQSEIENLEAEIKVLKDETADRLRAMKISGTKINGYYVSRVKRISFPDVSLEQAKEYGATIVKKDENKLRALLDKGIKLKAKFTEFISVRLAKENE